MSKYELELKQTVKFPRCRMYRQFIRTLMEDRTIRVSGGSGLFYFTVLCSYANFRTSYCRIGGINYTIYPGEWVCSLKDVQIWFRSRSIKQALIAMEDLQANGLITYKILGHGKVIRFKIINWHKHNTVLDYNAPCYKDTGFFFMPIATASELIGHGRCSEMDVVLDLWINTIYNDDQVQGSKVGPVVYMRNGTGSPIMSYSEMAERWGISKATVGRILKRLASKEYLSLFSYPGKQGSVIYLRSYLSTMFQLCDILLDKEEVALTLNISYTQEEVETSITTEACSVSDKEFCVSDLSASPFIGKVKHILSQQGFSCFDCPKSIYKLSQLSGWKKDCNRSACKAEKNTAPMQQVTLSCKNNNDIFTFAISPIRSTLIPEEEE